VKAIVKQNKLTKVFIIGSGLAFLATSATQLGNLVSSSTNQPTVSENTSQSQSAQIDAEVKGFLGVLKREPKNETALRGIKEIVSLRMKKGDVAGTKSILAQLIKIDPTNQGYKEFMAAIDKQEADAKKMGTLKPSTPQQSISTDPK
jgi:hypothetical protein